MGHAAETWTWDFFIAHAAKDGAVAEQLYSLLVDQSRPFLDSRCLELGDDWDAKSDRLATTSSVAGIGLARRLKLTPRARAS